VRDCTGACDPDVVSATDSERDSARRSRPAEAEVIETWLAPADLERFDRLAAKRGVDRNELAREAIDALLAQEAWRGGFMVPPPPMRVPENRIPTDSATTRRIRRLFRRS
jgi:hypothetical protein